MRCHDLVHIWGECRSLADPGTVNVEDYGNGDKYDSNATEECAGPVYTNTVEHIGCEEGEDSTGCGSKERVRCNS